ncbi:MULTISPECIES: septum formation initiator family protein [unclassified Roseitalea]|uniref:FtsB family cell division protein n=1 Tax=unclassified Roseitalea TaxID=2639107 RepID=UPI00273DE5EF|nr:MULTISPECIES: septum formation initiator family protein [unclassified Roseitalea]
MWTRQYRKSPLRHLIIPTLALAGLGYFGFHAINGSLGLTSKQAYEAELAALRAELAVLVAEREGLEWRTAALRDGSLQREMIDEQARKQLGMVRGNEVIVLHDR